MRKTKDKLEEMTIIELMEYWTEDWKQESPKLEDRGHYSKWATAVKKKTRTASILDLLKALDFTHTEIDYLEEITDMKARIGLELVGDLYEKVEQIEKSLQMLLKEHEHEPAKITVGQLNRLKGGI